MQRIISILLTIIFLQLSLVGYLIFFNNDENLKTELTENSNNIRLAIESNSASFNALPQSNEYTLWNQETKSFTKRPPSHTSQIDTVKVKEKLREPKDNIRVVNTLEEDVLALIQNSLYTTNIKNIKLLTPEQKKSLKHRQEKEKKLAKKRERKAQERISILKKIEKYAKTNLGKKYVWGAVGPNKFDCSGFTRAVYRSTVGINIPRVSREQAKVGQLIQFENLKLGDMVFFDTDKKFKKRVNHVGIYLSNGNFIHASSAKKRVIITNFRKKPFYKKRFLWGRRVVKVNS